SRRESPSVEWDSFRSRRRPGSSTMTADSRTVAGGGRSRRPFRFVSIVGFAAFVFTGPSFSSRAAPPPPKNTQEESIPLTSPEQAVASFAVPDGFSLSLFSSEPVVSQPIGMTTDTRGRLWVAENNTYAESRVNFDLSQHDRIVILEDADHDGRAEKHTVFW